MVLRGLCNTFFICPIESGWLTIDAETQPEQNNWWEKYAMCLTRHMTSDGKYVERVTLQINSPHLKQMLRDAVEHYPGVSFFTEKVSIDEAYHVLFHYRPEFLRAAERLEAGSEAADHVKLLLDFINETFVEDIPQHFNLTKQGLINYELLWTIFKPGTIFFGSMFGQPRAFKLNSYNYQGGNNPGFYLSSSYVDYDGDVFGTRNTTLRIPPFTGTASISALECVPEYLHKNKHSMRKALILRGALFQEHAGMHFSAYTGVALDFEEGVCSLKRVNVDGKSHVSLVTCALHPRLCCGPGTIVKVLQQNSRASVMPPSRNCRVSSSLLPMSEGPNQYHTAPIAMVSQCHEKFHSGLARIKLTLCQVVS